MKKSIIALLMLIFLYSCSTLDSRNKEYIILKTRLDALATQVKTNSINIQNNTLRLNSVEMKIMEIKKRLAKQREQDSFANKIPPLSAIIDTDNKTSGDNKITQKASIVGLSVKKQKKLKKAVINDSSKKQGNAIVQASSASLDFKKSNDRLKKTGYKRFYKQALNVYMSGNYEKAREMFEDFITQYKSNDLTDNAIFWLAHSYLHLGDKQKAEKELKFLVEHYPFGSMSTGGKTDAALYDLIKLYSNDKKKIDYYRKILFKRFPMSRYAKIVRKIEGG